MSSLNQLSHPSHPNQPDHVQAGGCSTVRVAAWQGRCIDGDVEANLAAAHRAIDLAAAERAHFLCLPETFLSGYGTREAVLRGALALDDPRLLRLAACAAGHGLTLLAGLAERLPDGRLGNTAAIFNEGRLLGAYRKTMRTESDTDIMGFCLDTDMPVFQAQGLRFGCIICHDSSFVEPALILVGKGAQLIFSPHYNGISAGLMDEHRIRTRSNHSGLATLLNVYVVRANVIGVSRGCAEELGYGDSVIIDPAGRVLAEAGLFHEGLICATINLRDRHRWASRAELPREVRNELAGMLRSPDTH
jgi:predicted amidohydrolase